MGETGQTRAVVRQVFEALQARDLERFRSLLAEDAVLDDPSSEDLHRGPDAIVGAVRVVLDAIPDLRPDVKNVLVDGPQAAAEVVRRGTHTGELQMAGATVPPTGREVRLPESIFFRVKDGKVVRMATYVDRMQVMKELGVEPSRYGEPDSGRGSRMGCS